MKFSILSQQTVIGVLPYSALLSGSTDLGDVLNSWTTFVKRAITALPTHPLSILYKSIPDVIATASTLADSFRLEAAPEAENDGVVTFKGVEYYIVDYETEDPARTEVTLSCIKKSVVDASHANERDDVVQLDTLDLLFTFVTTYLSTALTNAQFAKQNARSPVNFVPPVPPKIPTGGLYKALPYPAISAQTSPQKSTFKSTNGTDIDVAAAQTALSALLQKGSL